MKSLHVLRVGSSGPHVAFLHGLFGQGRNWAQIAKGIAGPRGTDASALLVDLPDHGHSPWSGAFSYRAYAQRVIDTLETVAPGEPWAIVGHSLGGKVAMMAALMRPHLVSQLAVVDIAPKHYGDLDRFVRYVEVMQDFPVEEAPPQRRDAEELFEEDDPIIKAFLLQNLYRSPLGWQWRNNLDLVAADAALGAGSAIAGFPLGVDDVISGAIAPYRKPTLWLVSPTSGYVTARDDSVMRTFFPKTVKVTVKGAGHWVHADSPEVVIDVLRRFLAADRA